MNTSTLDPWTYPDLAIAAGRAAFTGEGGGVMTADLDAFFDLERARDTVSVTLTLAGNGGGRVVSDDGGAEAPKDEAPAPAPEEKKTAAEVTP